MTVEILQGDCLDILPKLAAESIDSIVTDPPYGLSFMGKDWDHGIPGSHFWSEALRVAKPGAHLLAFGGTRTFHRLACAIEDAGWEIRDCIMWVYGSGFPKSLDVSKAIDKAAGAERAVVGVNENGSGAHKIKLNNHGPGDTGIGYMDGSGKVFNVTAPATEAAQQWAGWGTALKPAWEPIIVARKPLVGTVAANVQQFGTGGINIEACRIEGVKASGSGSPPLRFGGDNHRPFHDKAEARDFDTSKGRWPANVIHDGSDEVLGNFPNVASGEPAGIKAGGKLNCYGEFAGGIPVTGYGDGGSAARFFYCAKASGSDRESFNNHPTVKPVALMRYLVRLVTPLGAMCLDPFVGSGTTAVAAQAEGCNCIGVELNPDYVSIAKRRIQQRSLLA